MIFFTMSVSLLLCLIIIISVMVVYDIIIQCTIVLS